MKQEFVNFPTVVYEIQLRPAKSFEETGFSHLSEDENSPHYFLDWDNGKVLFEYIDTPKSLEKLIETEATHQRKMNPSHLNVEEMDGVEKAVKKMLKTETKRSYLLIMRVWK